MRYRLARVADLGLYEFVLADGGRIEWFLLGPDEARVLRGLIGQLGPGLEGLEFADVCGLVRAVVGAPPPGEELGWPRPLLG